MSHDNANTSPDGTGPVHRPVGRPVPARSVWPWRLLTRADKIQRGDQGLNDDCETWNEVAPFVCGAQYTPGLFLPIRRAMTGCTTPDACRGREGCSGACKTPNAEGKGPRSGPA